MAKLLYRLGIAFWLVFVLANNSAYGEQANIEGLLGPVKSVLEERLVLSSAGQVKTSEAISETEFTVTGLVSRIVWYKNNQMYREKTSLYDRKNRLAATGNRQTDGGFSTYSTYEYDDSGCLRQMFILKPDGSVFVKKLFRYNAKGLLAEQLSFDAQNKLEGRNSLLYNPRGKQIASYHYDSSDALVARATYEYDTAGNIIRETIYGGTTGNFPLKTIRYNSLGRKIAETNYNTDGAKVCEFRCEYYFDGNKLKQIHLRGDGTKYAETLYNEGGLPKAYLCFKADGSRDYCEEYQYNYDKTGNWTEITTIAIGGAGKAQLLRPAEVIKRTIKYY